MNSAKNSGMTPTKYFGYPIQTSIYGLPRKLVYGRNKVTGQVIWVGNFNPNGHSQPKKGGKSGEYDYQGDTIIALCWGPIVRINSIFVNESILQTRSSSVTLTVPENLVVLPDFGGGTFGSDGGVVYQQEYTATPNDPFSPGGTVNGIQTIPFTYTTTNPPGPGQYTILANGSYLFNETNAGVAATISYTWNVVDSETSNPGSADNGPIYNLGFTLFTGEVGQEPAGTDVLPSVGGQQLGYTGLAYVAAAQLDYGTSGGVANYSFEIDGIMQGLSTAVPPPYPLNAPYGYQGSNGFPDCVPFSVILDFLTNAYYGVGFQTNELGDPTELISYTVANGIFISPVVDSQRDARSWLSDWLLISNSEAVWSDGVMKFRTYGDTSQTANGLTFTPTTQPIYDIDDDNYISGKGEVPIEVTRPSVREAENDFSVEYSDRGNQYTRQTVEETDDFSVRLYGRRTASSLSYDCITSQVVAQTVALTQLRRSVYIRNQYTFKVGVAFCLLEPMDIITVTDPNLGLGGLQPAWTSGYAYNINNLVSFDGVNYIAIQASTNQEPTPSSSFWEVTGFGTPVRILEINEDDDGVFELTCEDFPWSAASPTLFPKQVAAPGGPFFASAGSVNTPGFVDLPVELSQGSEYTVGIALSGGPNWGGCDVYVSTSGETGTYTNIGRFALPQSTMGVLTAPLPFGTDPDTTNTLQVNLGESYGELATAVTANQWNAFTYLLAIDDEIISYQTATPTGSANYNVTNLRRGAYGTPITNHATEATVLSLNDPLFTWNYTDSVIGTTVFFKFTSFNVTGGNEESISNVAAYPFFVEGPRLPYPWNVGSGGTAPFSTTHQAILNYNRFEIQNSYEPVPPSALQASFVITGPEIVNQVSSNIVQPTIVLSTAPEGGTLAPGNYQVGIVTYNGTGYLPMIVEGISVPSGTSTNAIQVSVSFGDPGTDSAQIYLTPDQDFGWYSAGSIPVSSSQGMNVSIVDNTTGSHTLLVPGHEFTLTMTGAAPSVAVSVLISGTTTNEGTTSGSGTFTLTGTVPDQPGTFVEVWTAGTQSALLTFNISSSSSMTVDILDTRTNTSAVVYSGDPYTITIAGAAGSTNVVMTSGSHSSVVGTTNPSGVLTLSGTMALPAGQQIQVYSYLTTTGESGNAALTFLVGTTTGLARNLVMNQLGPLTANQVIDTDFNNYVMVATLEEHGGVFGGQVLSISSNGNGTCTITLEDANFSTNQFQGRVVSLVASDDLSNPLNIVDTQIVSNTATTIITTDLTSPDYVFEGDVMIIRTKPTATSSTTITDSGWINSGGTGLTPNAEIGNLVYIISGTGAFQDPRTITSNTTTQVTVSVPFSPVPDSTSIFVILDPTETYTVKSKALTNALSGQTVSMTLPMPNDQGNTYFIQVYTSDQNGNLSLESATPFREIYQYGGGAITIVDAANSPGGIYTVLSTDRILLVETTSGNITIQLPPAELEPGQIIYIKKATSDTNTVIIAASDVDGDQETIDGDNTYTLIGNGSNVTIASAG